MDTGDSDQKTLALVTSLHSFIDHVDELENEDDPSGDGFTREFRTIREHGNRMKEENVFPAEEGKKSCNIKKNRYRDILPFDETRVKLDEIPGEEGSDYINANFIKNHLGVESYIASQGPLPATVDDFWRMIIQYNVKVIAMACQTVEMGRKKCEQYWPSEDEGDKTELFGDVSVTLVDMRDLAENCVKRVLRAVHDGKEQIVTQFHYTYWPDHDIPKDFDAILEMMAEMRHIRAEDPDNSPMLIHCSAGCGRTGTICAIDYSWEILQTGQMTEDFSLHDIVMEMRTQRQSMIQAPEQYMMAHVIIKQLFQKHLEMMEDHTYGNVDFNPEESTGNDDALSISSEKSSSRKGSVLQHEIEVALRKITIDDSSLSNSKSLTKDSPIAPISPVREEPVQIPNVKAAKINNKTENIPVTKQTLKSQTSMSDDGTKRHVTTIAVGGSAPKQSVTQTKSQPPRQNTPGIPASRAKTFPTTLASKENPQSSIPPTIPTQSNQNVYSYARSDQIATTSTFPTTLASKEKPQSNIFPTIPTQSNRNEYSYARSDQIPSTSTTDNSYSAISNYSSVKNDKNGPPHTYHVLEKQGEVTLNGSAGTQSGSVYSVAQEPGNLYSAVQPKPNRAPKQNGKAVDDATGIYESIQVGEAGPPPIPNRGYQEEEQSHLDRGDKPPLGTGDSLTLSKAKLLSNFKNMFTPGKSNANTDTNSSSDIPGFKGKIGKKPSGPRDPPWTKK